MTADRDWDDWDEHELVMIRAGRQVRRLPLPVPYSDLAPLVFTPEDLGRYPRAHRVGGMAPAPDPDGAEADEAAERAHDLVRRSWP